MFVKEQLIWFSNMEPALAQLGSFVAHRTFTWRYGLFTDYVRTFTLKLWIFRKLARPENWLKRNIFDFWVKTQTILAGTQGRWVTQRRRCYSVCCLLWCQCWYFWSCFEQGMAVCPFLGELCQNRNLGFMTCSLMLGKFHVVILRFTPFLTVFFLS